MRAVGTAVLIVLLVGLVAAAAGPPEAVKGLKVFHRAGQTFITFKEIGPALPEKLTWGEIRNKLADSKVTYRIYAHDKPITTANLRQAKRIAEVRPFSGYNLNGRNVEYLIAQAMTKPDKMGELARGYNGFIHSWHMDHPRMDRYPVDQFVIDEKSCRLLPGTGLYVAHPQAPGKQYYAVVSCRADTENTKDFSAGNSLSKPVTETVGPGEPRLPRSLCLAPQSRACRQSQSQHKRYRHAAFLTY